MKHKFKKETDGINYWYTWVNPRSHFIGIGGYSQSKKKRDKDLETFKKELGQK